MGPSPIPSISTSTSKPPTKSASTVLAEAEAQWLFTETELSSTPSIADGMPLPTERDLRIKGLSFIHSVGIMLRIQQMTLHTAGVFFNRLLMRHSLQKCPANPKPLHHYQAAAVCLMLATKTDETIRRQKDIIIACCRVAQKNPTLQLDEQSKDYWRWRDTLLYNEDVLLEALCFDLTVESPYRILHDMLQKLGFRENKPLRNAAWAFLCDSLLTTLCLLQSSRAIAGAALYCGARHTGAVLPGDVKEKGEGGTNGHATPSVQVNGEVVPWFETIGVRVHDVKKACNYMADLYERGPSTTPAANGTYTPSAGGATPAAESEMSQGSSEREKKKESQYNAQDPRIYDGLREDLSEDEEEDGELVDEEDEDVGEMSGTGTPLKNGFGDSRGVKRSREDDDAG